MEYIKNLKSDFDSIIQMQKVLSNRINDNDFYFLNRVPFNTILFNDLRPALMGRKNGAAYYCSEKNTFFSLDVVALSFIGFDLKLLISQFNKDIELEDKLTYLLNAGFDNDQEFNFSYRAGYFEDEKTSFNYPFACNELNYYNTNISNDMNLIYTNALVKYSHMFYFLMQLIHPESMFMQQVRQCISTRNKEGLDVFYFVYETKRINQILRRFMLIIEKLENLNVAKFADDVLKERIDVESAFLNIDKSLFS